MRTKGEGKYLTRESWLMAAVKELNLLFADTCDLRMPEQWRVSCGWPTRKGSIGQCFAVTCSTGGYIEMFISPVLDDATRILDVLAHEMIHAIVGLECGHKGEFKRVALAIGLTEKMTATVADPILAESLRLIAQDLGEYPHDTMILRDDGKKKDGTRLIKCVCPDCEYTIRTTRKWIDTGLPTCHCGARFIAEGLPHPNDDTNQLGLPLGDE